MAQVHSHTRAQSRVENVSSPRIAHVVPPELDRGGCIFNLDGITAEDWLGGVALVVWVVVLFALAAMGGS